MKNLRQIIENKEPFTLSKEGYIKYNAMDSDEHKTGVNSKGQKVFNCVYSVYKIDLDTNTAFTEANNAFGGVCREQHPLTHLVIYNKGE